MHTVKKLCVTSQDKKLFNLLALSLRGGMRKTTMGKPSREINPQKVKPKEKSQRIPIKQKIKEKPQRIPNPQKIKPKQKK
jgi:hypothetical protein